MYKKQCIYGIINISVYTILFAAAAGIITIALEKCTKGAYVRIIKNK